MKLNDSRNDIEINIFFYEVTDTFPPSIEIYQLREVTCVLLCSWCCYMKHRKCYPTNHICRFRILS